LVKDDSVAKAVSKSKQNRPAGKGVEAARAARSQKEQGKGKEQTKAPSRWARARSAAKRTRTVRNAARPAGAKAEKRGLRTFFHDVRVEMSKVTWPTRKDLIQSTIVVIVAVIIAGAYTGALDFVFSRIVDAVLKLIGA
jgi:preprotein translocase subunit SecE